MVLQWATTGDTIFNSLVGLVGRDRFNERWPSQSTHLSSRANTVTGTFTIGDTTNLDRLKDSLEIFVFTKKGKQLRSEEHTSELQSRPHLVCRLLLEKKNK